MANLNATVIPRLFVCLFWYSQYIVLSQRDSHVCLHMINNNHIECFFDFTSVEDGWVCTIFVTNCCKR